MMKIVARKDARERRAYRVSRKMSCFMRYFQHLMTSRSKIKCTGEQPACASCSRRQIECIYSSSTRTQRTVLSGSTTERSYTLNSRQPRRREQPDNQLPYSEAPLGRDDLGFYFADPMYNANESPTSIVKYPSYMPAIHLSSEFPTDSYYLLGGTDLNTNLDWLFDSASADGTLESENLDQLSPSLGWPESQSRQPKEDIRQQNIMDEASSRETNNLSLAIVVQPESSCGPQDPWPMEWHAEYLRPPLDLPNLGASMAANAVPLASFFSQFNLQSSTIDQLAQFLRMPSQRSPWHAVELKHFPSKEKLELCIDNYFAHFHKVLLGRPLNSFFL